ncbi:hypothetical protein DEU56DRAFT_920405 [Suillus clintonianus]|uniref:uncharacterized protein n=1 Tax=Suillus clintonianus TaxID=1904413 RepID=UPI001B85E8B6|nr:uncharacterized protein DEU56DRAFT_920405 [Suillus clintonianus]KAG2109136.1 hypothetical protein DEU56DRAFT_920405 [Suillus clintonianus]
MSLVLEGSTSISGSTSLMSIDGQQNDDHDLHRPLGPSQPETTFVQAQQRRKIAELEGKLEALESGRAIKENSGMRAKRIVTLFDSIEELVAENDRRYDDDSEEDATLDQDRLLSGYHTLLRTLPWFLKKASDIEPNDFTRMLKMLRQGADGARGDDTSKLKTLVADWVNRALKPNPSIDPDDKHCRGSSMTHVAGYFARLNLTGTSQCRDSRSIRGLHVTDLSFPAFLYENYTANPDNLEEGIFKGKILLQAYKAVFTSPSSAKDVECDGDGADVIANNRRAKKAFSDIKVKKHVAQIIKMDKVTARSIAYIACQVRFALSSITSWRSVDGDFDYIKFWQTIVDSLKSLLVEKRSGGQPTSRVVDKVSFTLPRSLS